MATQSWSPGVASAILNCYLRGSGNSITSPTAVYFKLHKNTGATGPGAAGTTAPSSETVQPQISFNAASAGVISSGGTFGTLAWTGNAGGINVSGNETLAYFSLWTSTDTSGTFILSGTITSTNVNPGDLFSIASGNVQLTMTVAS